MNPPLLKRLVRDSLPIVLLGLLAIAGASLLGTALYRDIPILQFLFSGKETPEYGQLRTLLRFAPGERAAWFEQALDEIEPALDHGYLGYVAIQHWFKNLGLFGTMIAVVLGGGAIARDTSTGAMRLLVSRPVSRSRLLATTYLAGLLAVALTLFLATGLAEAGGDRLLEPLRDEPSVVANPNIAAVAQTVPALHATLYAFLLVWPFYGLAFLLSTWMNDPIRPIAYAGGGAVLMMLVAWFSNWETWGRFSIYFHADAIHYLEILSGRIGPLTEIDPGDGDRVLRTLPRITFTAVPILYAASAWRFCRRDF